MIPEFLNLAKNKIYDNIETLRPVVKIRPLPGQLINIVEFLLTGYDS